MQLRLGIQLDAGHPWHTCKELVLPDVERHNKDHQDSPAAAVATADVLNVSVGKLEVCLSYEEVMTVLEIVGGMNPLLETGQDDRSSRGPGMDDRTLALDRSNNSGTMTRHPGVCGAARIHTEGLKVTLISHWEGVSEALPVAELFLRATGDIVAVPLAARGELGLQTRISYHNHKIAQWEPVLEPWEAQVDIDLDRVLAWEIEMARLVRAAVPCCVVVGVVTHTTDAHTRTPQRQMQGDAEEEETVGEDEGDRVTLRALLGACPMKVSVSSQALLNLNLTDALLDTLGGVLRTWALAQELRASSESRVARLADTREEFSLHRIRNDTGLALVYCVRGGVTRVLQPGEEAPLHLLSRQAEDDEDLLPAGRVMEATHRNLVLSLDVPGEEWQPVEGVAVEHVGVRLYELRTCSDGATTTHRRGSGGTASVVTGVGPSPPYAAAPEPSPTPSSASVSASVLSLASGSGGGGAPARLVTGGSITAAGGNARGRGRGRGGPNWPHVVCESTITQGSIMLRVRSTVLVKNFMSELMAVAVLDAEGRTLWRTVLPPHGMAPVPVHLVHAAVFFQLQPATRGSSSGHHPHAHQDRDARVEETPAGDDGDGDGATPAVAAARDQPYVFATAATVCAQD